MPSFVRSKGRVILANGALSALRRFDPEWVIVSLLFGKQRMTEYTSAMPIVQRFISFLFFCIGTTLK